MSRLTLLVAVLLPLTACAPAADDDDDTPVDWGYELDPDVESYIPAGYKAEDPARVIFLGDSITNGAGASSGSLDYPSLLVENDRSEWSGWDDQDLTTLFGDDLDVIDVSRGGATTQSLIDDQLPALSGRLGDSVSGPTIVVMTVGGNDMQDALLPILNADDQDAVADGYIDIVEENMGRTLDYFDDTDRFPDGAWVYFANVYEPTDAVGQSNSCFFGIDFSTILRYFNQANSTMISIAKDRGAAMVDMRGHFLGHGVYATDENIDAYHEDDPTQWFAQDCVHPNDRGHHELRRLFLTAIEGRPLEAQHEVP
jgi:lysophospholipase L1-like esterase